MPKVDPNILYGKLVDWISDNPHHLLVVQIDALSRTPTSSTLEELIQRLNYYNPYGPTNRSTSWDKQYMKQPRQPADIIFAECRTRSKSATICSLVTLGYHGPPTPGKSLPNCSGLPENHLQIVNSDDATHCIGWFQKSFADLAKLLTENESLRPPSGNIMIEGEMLLDHCDREKPHKDKMEVVREFTWLMKTRGISTSIIFRNKQQNWDDINTTAVLLPFHSLSNNDWNFPILYEEV